jgi:hypothetical protein
MPSASYGLILKMNFNFNFKDSLAAADPSMRNRTSGRDQNHTEKLSA